MLILLPFQAEVCGESKCPNCLFRVHCCKWLVTTTSCLSGANSPGGPLIYTAESRKARLVATFLPAIQNHLELLGKAVCKNNTNEKHSCVPRCGMADICTHHYRGAVEHSLHPKAWEASQLMYKMNNCFRPGKKSSIICMFFWLLNGIPISLTCVRALNMLYLHFSAFIWELLFA